MGPNETYAILMMIILIAAVFLGLPVALVMASLGILAGTLAYGSAIISYQAALNVFGVMSGWELLAIPLFVFMGVLLEKADIAAKLYLGFRLLFGRVRGGLLIATMGIAILFAACTGIAGASVIAIGLIAFPSMLKYGYDKRLCAGAICAGGGLGVIIPPSLMLIVYGPVAGVSISLLFFAAMVPGILMGLTYIVYITIVCLIWPSKGPAATVEELAEYSRTDIVKLLLYAGAPPMALIFAVLGGIFFGFAAPTEAAALGSLGAFVLTLIYKRFSFKMLRDSCYSALGISSFIMWLVLGAKFFMTSFNKLGGGAMIERGLLGLNVGPDWMLIVMLGIIFILGFVMDWIGILLVVVPIFVPIVATMGWNPLWFAVMFGITLQISYITPPFAYSIFYLKGIAPKGVTLADICYGCVPFIFLQFIDLYILYLWPQIALYLPGLMTAAK